MLDRRWIIENPEAFTAGLTARLFPNADNMAEKIAFLDRQLREAQTELQQAQARRNEIAGEIGRAKRQNRDADTTTLVEEANRLRTVTDELESTVRAHEGQLTDWLLQIPNMPDPEVPPGGEDQNREVSRTGNPTKAGRHHYEFGPALGMDFDTGVALAGSRFVFLRGQLARLERALVNFCLDRNVERFGCQEVSPPLMVKPEVMRGTGQLPKFENDLFAALDGALVEQGMVGHNAEAGHWLIPTAEVPLTNTVAGKILDPHDLPIRLTAATPCFRAEAGAAGRDMRGLIRTHQFMKVELVSIVGPERSGDELNSMLAQACSLLDDLGLPYRTVLLAAGDMGFAAARTYDIEVWLPGQQSYREISSVSNCGDFQARRMNARYRPDPTAKPVPVHTLNGSGLAISRLMVAVLENYQEADGSVLLPEALRPYMGTMTLNPQ